jgi:uncharacterized membrane protein YhdT
VVAAGLVNANYGVGVGVAYIIGRFLFIYIDSSTLFFIQERMALEIQVVLLELLFAILQV